MRNFIFLLILVSTSLSQAIEVKDYDNFCAQFTSSVGKRLLKSPTSEARKLFHYLKEDIFRKYMVSTCNDSIVMNNDMLGVCGGIALFLYRQQARINKIHDIKERAEIKRLVQKVTKQNVAELDLDKRLPGSKKFEKVMTLFSKKGYAGLSRSKAKLLSKGIGGGAVLAAATGVFDPNPLGQDEGDKCSSSGDSKYIDYEENWVCKKRFSPHFGEKFQNFLKLEEEEQIQAMIEQPKICDYLVDYNRFFDKKLADEPVEIETQCGIGKERYTVKLRHRDGRENYIRNNPATNNQPRIVYYGNIVKENIEEPPTRTGIETRLRFSAKQINALRENGPKREIYNPEFALRYTTENILSQVGVPPNSDEGVTKYYTLDQISDQRHNKRIPGWTQSKEKMIRKVNSYNNSDVTKIINYCCSSDEYEKGCETLLGLNKGSGVWVKKPHQTSPKKSNP